MNWENTQRTQIRSFVSGLIILLLLMITTYVSTLIIPAGSYQRILDESGNEVVVSDSFSFDEDSKSLGIGQFLLSPFLVLGAEGNTTVIAVGIFLLVIGGAFNCLNACRLTEYMIEKLTHRYAKRRYFLLAVLAFVFMLMGSFVGSFEEVAPLVPILVGLCASLGFDALTGLGVSLVAAACGFSAGVMNPFSVGVAQSVAGLEMFSGIWLRIVSFTLVYGLLYLYIYLHAKKIDKRVNRKAGDFTKNKAMDRAIIVFAAVIGFGFLCVISSTFIKFLQDYTMIIIALMFLVGGIGASLVSGMKGKELLKTFLDGSLSMLPSLLMILMASSIKYILVESGRLDTVIYFASSKTQGMSKIAVILFLYLIVLFMNFFIPSGSAKALLIMPLIVPIAIQAGIPLQLCVIAYAFGDGFSNVLYPTNPVLLLSLGFGNVEYPKYFKYIYKFQLLILALTSAILVFGLAVGYN